MIKRLISRPPKTKIFPARERFGKTYIRYDAAAIMFRAFLRLVLQKCQGIQWFPVFPDLEMKMVAC